MRTSQPKVADKRQRGVALITVLMVMAMAVIVATNMSAGLQLQIQRVENLQSNNQAYWYALSAEALAKSVLEDDYDKEKEHNHLKQMWAQGETTFPVENGEISGEISDLHACLNLNNLRPEKSQNSNNPEENKLPARIAFEELVLALELEGVDQFQVENMADALTDWLDEGTSLVSAGGAEDNDYSAKVFPYLPANSYMASVNELRIIEHFTVPMIEKLKPFVCVIPNQGETAVNVNTITEEQTELLQGLLGGISRSDAESIISARPDEGWEDISNFWTVPEVQKVKDLDKFKPLFDVKSRYFKLDSQTTYNDSYFSLTSILKITGQGRVVVMNRAIGAQ